MKKFNRELLVLLTENRSREKIEQEVELLHDILFNFEQIDQLIVAHDLIDINRRKISTSGKRLKSAFKTQNLKPFVFLFNLN